MEDLKMLSQKYVLRYIWILTTEKSGMVTLKVSFHFIAIFSAIFGMIFKP